MLDDNDVELFVCLRLQFYNIDYLFIYRPTASLCIKVSLGGLTAIFSHRPLS